jgi:type IV pilus assembly protein PilC
MAAANVIFAYEGTDKSGRKTKGEITSSNAKIAKAELRKQGINATKVSKKGGGLAAILNAGQKVGASDIALFTRQLATMMKAGVPLVQSFEIVADGIDNPAMKTLILQIRDDVSSGNSFANRCRRAVWFSGNNARPSRNL